MEYHEAVNFLFDLHRFQVKPGTESVRALLSQLGDPHGDLDFVQIAGSNGKGSTARMVESILREAGYTVGLYTSPHFEDLRERVRVDGRKISEAALCSFVDEVKPYLVDRAAAGEPLTFFETMTALSLWQFGRRDVDVAVLEVGMGGKLDATSVVDPVASAVTNVSLEHTDILGDSIEEIATKKAHVAAADAPLVTAARGDALEAIRTHTDDVVTVGDTDEDADVVVSYDGRVSHAEAAVRVTAPDWTLNANIPLLGAYQARNAGIAATLVDQLDDRLPSGVPTAAVQAGLRNAHWPGRFEVMECDPLVVLDGAHNPGACAELAAVLDEFDYDDLHLVFGAMHDKDYRAMAAALPEVASVTTCRSDVSRAETPEILARVFETAGVDTVTASDAALDALATARDRAGPDDCILVTGSLYCVAEARTSWTRTAVPKRAATQTAVEETLARAHVDADTAANVRDEGVHRVVTTRVQKRQAQYLTETLGSLGGTGTTSGHAGGGELVDVVLMGTVAQFRALLDRLDDAPLGLADVARTLRSQLELDVEPARHGYPWEDGPAVMGILNVTPDSFHDGGAYVDVGDAVDQAERMIDAGVDIIDIGGESTRPGADPVPVEAEIDRVVPVIEAIADLDASISVDTRKAAVGRAALDAGADILNDVTGLEDPEMRFLAADRDVPVIVMHSIDAPVVPDRDVEYDDVVTDVVDELRERVLLAEKAGIPRENVIVDPGLGFGKSNAEDFELLGRLDELDALGCPILFGHSHKSMFGHVGCPADERLAATVAGTALAVERGADIVRVHDVRENADAIRVVEAAAGAFGPDDQ